MNNAGIYLKKADLLNKKYYYAVLQNRINLELASIYCDQNPVHDSKAIFKLLIADFRKALDTLDECVGWMDMGTYLGREIKALPYRIICFQRALLLTRQLNNTQFEMDFLRGIVGIHLQQNKIALAESALFSIINDCIKATLRSDIFG